MLKKILVAYDDGSQASNALQAAIDLAKHTAAEIHLVSAYYIPARQWETSPSVDDVGKPYNTPLENTIDGNIRNHLEKIQAEAAEKVRQENIIVHTAVREGQPGEVIIHMAENIKADLIAIGTHNRGIIGKLFMGSVSQYVVNHATCQVLIVKH